MAHQFNYSKNFKKHYKKLSVLERKQIIDKLKLLEKDPTHPSLRTKRIRATTNLYESSVNMDIRIIWHYEANGVITLLDVGHHDILKQF